MASDTNREQSHAEPALIIDAGQYEKLRSIAAQAPPAIGERLLFELERADLRPTGEMPASVVQIGSQVTFRDDASGRTQTVAIAFPGDADIEARRVSVLAPIGAALIGLSAGQQIRWEMPDGNEKLLTVIEVTQPADDPVKH